jgi:hypothetical protein
MTAWSRWPLGAAVLVAASVARAQAPAPAAPPSEAQVEAAKAAYREARELEKQGRFKEAAERALDALRTAGTPVTALEAGQLLAQTGQLVQARDVLRSVALMPVSPRESDKGREARQDAAALAAKLDARIPKVALAARPANVEVLLDGKPLASTDPTAWQGVDPGAHAVVVRADDKPCTTINVTLAEAEARTIDLHDATAACRPEPAPPAIAPEPATTPAPAHVEPSPAPPPPREDESNPWPWVGGAIAGAGVIAVGVGGALALGAKGDYDGVADQCPARGCTQSAYDTRVSARSQAATATVVMIAGGAAVATGAVIFFVPGSSHRAAVGVGPRGATLSFAIP